MKSFIQSDVRERRYFLLLCLILVKVLAHAARVLDANLHLFQMGD